MSNWIWSIRNCFAFLRRHCKCFICSNTRETSICHWFVIQPTCVLMPRTPYYPTRPPPRRYRPRILSLVERRSSFPVSWSVHKTAFFSSRTRRNNWTSSRTTELSSINSLGITMISSISATINPRRHWTMIRISFSRPTAASILWTITTINIRIHGWIWLQWTIRPITLRFSVTRNCPTCISPCRVNIDWINGRSIDRNEILFIVPINWSSPTIMSIIFARRIHSWDCSCEINIGSWIIGLNYVVSPTWWWRSARLLSIE